MLPSSCVSIFRARKVVVISDSCSRPKACLLYHHPHATIIVSRLWGPQTSLLVSCNAVLYYLYDTPFAAFFTIFVILKVYVGTLCLKLIPLLILALTKALASSTYHTLSTQNPCGNMSVPAAAILPTKAEKISSRKDFTKNRPCRGRSIRQMTQAGRASKD